jgi:general secretion pathway protein K
MTSGRLAVAVGGGHFGQNFQLRPWARTRGAAIIAAMLTVSVVALFAYSALMAQHRAYEVERAERARAQAAWLLHGAMDWARLVLREDARSGGIDHLGEPWAIPLKEAKLSEFLATGPAGAAVDATNNLEDAFLSGEIIDLQSRLNLTNLVGTDGRVSAPDYAAFQRLFSRLGLPSEELERAANNMVAAQGKTAAPHATPLLPQKVDQLRWLGISATSVEALGPHVTILPTRTALNLNTASPEAMYAAIGGISVADAQKLAASRLQSPFRTTNDAAKVLGMPGQGFMQSEVALSVATQYFQISARLQLEDNLVQQRWVVQRNVSKVIPLSVDSGAR